MAIERFHGFLSLFSGAHRDKTETARTAGRPVHHQIGFRDSAMSCKQILQVVFGGIEGKIPHKQFIIHNDFTDLMLFPDRSRLPDLKSSMNRIHLRIPHILKETSCRTDEALSAVLSE
jgi:hypothetical protein